MSVSEIRSYRFLLAEKLRSSSRGTLARRVRTTLRQTVLERQNVSSNRILDSPQIHLPLRAARRRHALTGPRSTLADDLLDLDLGRLHDKLILAFGWRCHVDFFDVPTGVLERPLERWLSRDVSRHLDL